MIQKIINNNRFIGEKMKSSIISFLVICSCIFFQGNLGASPKDGCPGSVNLNPLVETPPSLVAQVSNGRKYTIPYDGRFFYILDLNGSAYEMGLAEGHLMKEEMLVEAPLIFE